jgi:hypothetical protein
MYIIHFIEIEQFALPKQYHKYKKNLSPKLDL